VKSPTPNIELGERRREESSQRSGAGRDQSDHTSDGPAAGGLSWLETGFEEMRAQGASGETLLPRSGLTWKKSSGFYARNDKHCHGRKKGSEPVARGEVIQPGINRLAREVARANCMLGDHAQIEEGISYLQTADVNAVGLDSNPLEVSHLEKCLKPSADPVVSDASSGSIQHDPSRDFVG
jgi:hypothetical protein